MSFPLSDQPVFGEWFIFVEEQGHTYNKSFEVQKYGETPHVQESSLSNKMPPVVLSCVFFIFSGDSSMHLVQG